jgi:hypothetical protein
MELILGSETLTNFNQTPGLHPKENTLHQQHGESLKTKIVYFVAKLGLFLGRMIEYIDTF